MQDALIQINVRGASREQVRNIYLSLQDTLEDLAEMDLGVPDWDTFLVPDTNARSDQRPNLNYYKRPRD